MQQQSEKMLDQLWFTWSTSGLGSMPMGYRVRAASVGLYDTQGMYYRRVNRFVNYELPQGVTVSEFSTTIAPVSLALVNNGEECLLIRKIYIGQDAVGRNGNFFTHLIAGLPKEFTARDAIHLWYCPDLWVESEAGKASSDKSLKQIPYSTLRSYADHPQASFNVASVSEPLRNLLLLILTTGLPEHIEIRGHSTLIATLIYGLTHALPMKFLPGLTFTTYESETQESETLIMGTINGAELQDQTMLQVQPILPVGIESLPEDLRRYVDTAINVLVTGIQSEKFFKVIDEIDRRDKASVDDLLELFKRRFQIGPFTSKQMEDTLLHPNENVEDLTDPTFQDRAVHLLLNDPDYWESRGQQIFHNIQEWLISSEQSRNNKRGRDAMLSCLDGMSERLYTIIRTEVLHGQLPARSTSVLVALHHPSTHRDIYQRMLAEFVQEQFYRNIRTDALWPFQLWLLSCAGQMQPLPEAEHISPWQRILNWEKLADILKLNLPGEWENDAIYILLSANREIPKTAFTIVKTHEAKFMRVMRTLLIEGSQTGKQEKTDAALRLFAAIIRYEEQGYNYPNRVGLLMALLNAVPEDTTVIEALFATVPFASPYQLSMPEFDLVVAGCRPEVLAAGGASPSLMKYLLEYILALTPKKLNPNTVKLLEQFQRASATLPEGTARLVNSWLDMNAFLANKHFDDKRLRKIEPALATLVPLLHQRGQDIWHTFVQELAPYLTTLIETEYQLQIVLNVFEGGSVIHAWDLLNVLANHTGAIDPQNLSLSRFFPYVIVGIREFARLGQPESVLDAYYKSLFAKVSDHALGEVDKAISAQVWAEPIQKEWRGWRERSKPSFIGKVKEKLSSQSSKPQAGTNPITYGNQAPSTWQNSNQSPPKKITLPAKNAPDKDRFQFTTSDGGEFNFYDSSYQRYHRTLSVVLPYWIGFLQTYNPKANNSLQFEVRTLSSLFEELQRLSPQDNSEKLVQYLIDDHLIQLEIAKLNEKRKSNISYYFNPENYISPRLQEFQLFVSQPGYQKSLNENYSEQAIKEVLSSLIRRFHFILHMNENSRGGWEKWIKKEESKTEKKLLS